MDIETLRQKLLEEIQAGAFAGGFRAMLLDEQKVKDADDEELMEIARRYGFDV